MKWHLWHPIARRHMAYYAVLQERMAERTKERIEACTNREVLAGVIKPTERVERNRARMDRHQNVGMH
jgi:hypothetical protein